MQFEPMSIPDLKLITSKKFDDGRGFFAERYRADVFAKNKMPSQFVQENYSRSEADVLRGLHYQYDGPQGKLVTCTAGKIFDVAVDIRHRSPSFGKVVTVVLSGDNPQWFWVPAGFAHGFCVLSPEGADILYKVTEYYNPKGEGGIRWDDAFFSIPWPSKNPKLSPRDTKSPSWADYCKDPKF